MSDAFRAFSVDDAIAAAARALSRASGEPTALEEIAVLSGEQRRNHVIRAVAHRPSGDPQCVVVKATRAAGYDAMAEDAFAAAGSAREWAAAALLATRAPDATYLARFLAGDAAAGVMVFADLGQDLPLLASTLLHGSPAEAETAMLAYATNLGHLHATTVGCSESHTAAVREAYPNAQVPLRGPGLARSAAVAASLLGEALPEAEFALLLDRLRDPGPWLALVHGDLCPDNVLLTAQGPVFLDFEFAAPGHALLDAAYWRTGFPTCWCAGRVPDAVADRADQAYRDAVAAGIPHANDAAIFHRERAAAMVAHMLGSLAWHIERALGDTDYTWGIATNRSRILWRVQAAIESLQQAEALPGICRVAERWLDDLRHRWPDAEPLSFYPAFAATPES